MKRTIRIYYLLIACLLSFYGGAQAQLIQKSYTTSNGGGLSTGTGISQFGVAGQSVIGATTGGNYQMKVGFLATVASDYPSAPGDFAVHPVGVSSLRISWSDNDATNTGYVLERSENVEFSDPVVFNLGADATSYLDEVLAVDTYYYYRIKTVRNELSSSQLNDATATFSEETDENWLWSAQLQSRSYGRGLAYDAAGNLYVASRLEESGMIGANSLTVSGNGDAVLIKHDPDGNILWVRQLASSGSVSIERVKIDPNGVVYVSGYFNGELMLPGGGTISSAGQNDAFAGKFNNSGQLLWLRTFGGSASDIVSAHVIDGAGNIHLLYGSGSFDGKYGINALLAGLHIVSIKPDGGFLATRSVATGPGISGNDLARDGSGNFYIAGSFSGNPTIAGTPMSSLGGRDAFYAKLTPSGTDSWVKAAASDQDDNAYTIGIRDSKVYVGGFFDGTVIQATVSADNTGERDGFLLAADAATGTGEWIQGIGGPGDEGVLAMDFTPTDVFISGFYGGEGVNFVGTGTSLSNGFAFLARYDATGALLAANRIEGKANELTTARGLSVYKNIVSITGRKSGKIKLGGAPLEADPGLAMFTASYKYEDVCNTPVSFAVTNVEATTADLSWNIEGGLEFNELSYKIRYKPFGTITWTEETTNGTSFQLTGLLGGVKYLVQVSMLCGNPIESTSPYTGVVEFTTPGEPACVVPVISSDASTSDTEHQVSWEATAADTYDLRYRLKGTLAWTTISGLTASPASITGLSAGMSYQVQLRGLCTDIQTVFSPVYEFTTTGAVSCAVPSDIAVTNIETNSADLSWTDQSALSYEVRYKVNGTSIWTTASTSTASVTLSDLDAGMPYVYIVRAQCSIGLYSEFSPAAMFETSGAPSCEVPVGFTVEASENSASISWSSATGAVYYDLRYRVQGTAVWSSQRVYANSATLEGLSAGTAYQLQARSACTIDGSFVSLYSANFVFQTTGSSVCNTPAELVAIPGTTTASLSWAAQEGVSSYQVRYRLEGSTFWSTLTTATNSAEISSLVSGMPYMWTARAICNAEGTLASPYAAIAYFDTEGEITCAVPEGLNVSNVEDVSATAVWTTTGAPAYQLRYRLGGTAFWTIVESATNTFDLSGLEPGMPYQLQVKSKCEADGSVQSAFSTVFEFETSGAPSCEIPVGLAVQDLSTTTATLTWSEFADAFGYTVRYRIKGTAIWTLVTTDVNSLELAELEPGMPYQFSVRSDCSESPVVSSVFSVPAEFVTEGLPSCEVPAGFAVAAGDTDAEISWDNLGSLQYEIRYRVSGATLWTLQASNNNVINLGELQTGTDYQFQVRSVCSEDGSIKSLFSDVQFFETTGSVSCEMPTGLSLVLATENTAEVEWMPAAGVLQYDVRYRVKGTTIWQQLTTETASASLTGLVSGMPYQLRVRTLCSADNSLVSAYSQILEFTTGGDAACAVPENLSAGLIEQTTAQLLWDASTGALGYEILYRREGDIIWTAVNSSETEVNLSGLTSLTTYQWKVRTNCSSDNSLKSLYSGVSSFGTLAEPGARTQEDTSGDSEVSELSAVLRDMDVVVYPNPSSDKVFLRLTSPVQERYTVSVFNINGQLVSTLFDGTIGEDETTELMWDGAGSPAGMYVLKLSSAGASISKKIILDK